MAQVPTPLSDLLAPNRYAQFLKVEAAGPESGIGASALVSIAGGAVKNVYFVDSATGADGNDGRDPTRPLATIQAAVDKVSSGDTIFVSRGDGYSENVSTPLYGGADNVALIGLTANGYRVTISPASNTSPTFDFRTNMWRLSGFTIVNPTSVVAGEGGGIRLNMDAASPTAGESFSPDTLIDNCLIVGAGIAIDFVGAPYWCTIQDCEFFGVTVAITCSNSGVAIPFRCRVLRNIFHNNDYDIDMAYFASRGFNSSLIQGNYFFANARGATPRIDLTGGRHNLVVGNYLDDAADAAAYVGGTDDMWNNWTDDDAAQPEPGVP